MEKPEKERSYDSLPGAATEMWFSVSGRSEKDIREAMESGALRATIRLGNRSISTKDPKGGYVPGKFVELKIKCPDGSFDSFSKTIVILGCELKEIGELAESDLEGAILDGLTTREVRESLASAYGRPIEDKEMISMVRFEYKDNLRNARDLIEAGVLLPAKEPAGNPEKITKARYSLPLIEHDYPAKTAIMWNAAYQAFGLDAENCMLVGDPKFSAEILEVFRKDANYLGGGAGVGFKDEAVKFVDELDERAKLAGSINFVLRTPEGKLRGYNTDGIGYAQSLEDLFKKQGSGLKGKKVVLLGAGGTANAIGFALAERGAELVILNRTASKAQELALRINAASGTETTRYGGEENIQNESKSADAVVNVSTKGAAGLLEKYSALAPGILPASPENIATNLKEAGRVLTEIPQRVILSDIVLTKGGTPFLRSSKAAGFTTLDGIPMVINQGIEAFWIAHGEELVKKGVSKERLAEVMTKAARKEK